MASHSTQNHSERTILDGDYDHLHHVTPMKTYLSVAMALFALTILTVIAHNMHLGVIAAPIAFLIASIKAVLVMGWFMHLKDEGKLNRVIFGSGFFFLVLLLFFCGLDILTRVAETNTL